MKNLDIILGYGINQLGAINRDGSLSSYDRTFETLKEAEEWLREIEECGYRNRYFNLAEVTVEDELKAMMEEYVNEDEFIYDEDKEYTLKYFKKYINVDITEPEWDFALNRVLKIVL